MISAVPDWIRVQLADGGHMRIRVSSIDLFLPTGNGGTKLLLGGQTWITVDREFADELERALTLGIRWEGL